MDGLRDDVERVLFDRHQIEQAARRLGARLAEAYRDKNPLIVGALKGSFMFTADLVRQMDIACEIDFIAASSYGSGTQTSGQVKIIKDLDTNVAGRHVILVEDIIDTGVTLAALLELVRSRGPASVAVCTLFDKPARRRVDLVPEYVGYEVPDEFIVGYGLDYNEKYRNMPDVGILKREIYAE